MSTVKHAQSLDQIHNDITGLKLELEIVHNKKKLLQDDRWERSYYKDENQVILKTRQWFTSYYLLTQIIPFIYYSITKRIFRNIEPKTLFCN